MNAGRAQSMVGRLGSVLVKRPEDAWRSEAAIDRQWRRLGYVRRPDLATAAREHARLVDLLSGAGAEVRYLPPDARTGLDSIYTHDPLLPTDRGAIVLNPGKAARRGEAPAMEAALAAWAIPVLGVMRPPATAEGGDLLWLDAETLVAGRGFRTNAAGIEFIAALVAGSGVTVTPVHLPCWNGPAEVLHLMSFISLLDSDLAVVYRRLLPVPFVELLRERRIELVEVPDEEWASQGANVLALAPRNAVMLEGNPVTRERLEAAGCRVTAIAGRELAFPGAGGPTCLTRPLWRG